MNQIDVGSNIYTKGEIIMYTPVETADALLRLRNAGILPKFILLLRVKKDTMNQPVNNKLNDTFEDPRVSLITLKKKQMKSSSGLAKFIKKKFYKQLKETVGKKNTCMIAGFSVQPYSSIFDPKASTDFTPEELADANILVIKVIKGKKRDK